jgi:hypothetical protein
MSGIFISYRHEDSSAPAHRLYDDLCGEFGRRQVFIDIHALSPGVDFSRTIQEKVGSCDVLLAVIGKQWLSSKDNAGNQRINDPKDWVHQEIAAALAHNIPAIPVRVQGAMMPREEDLSKDLKRLVAYQEHELTEKRWKYDVGELMKGLKELHVKESLGRRLTQNAGGAVGAGGALYVTNWHILAQYIGLAFLPNPVFWPIVFIGAGVGGFLTTKKLVKKLLKESS